MIKLLTILTSIAQVIFLAVSSVQMTAMAEQLLLVNPKKRKPRATRSKAPRIRRRSYRRNPARLNVNTIFKNFKAGAVGAAGAVAVDFAMRRLPLPAALMTSRFQPAVRGLVGVGLGYLVSRFLKQRTLGEELATGSVAVSLYGVAKNMMLPPPMPTGDEEMSGYGDLLGVGDDGLLGMGYFNPAAVSGDPFSNGLEYQPAPSDGGDFF